MELPGYSPCLLLMHKLFNSESLADLALGKTLEYALDIDGYRSYLGFHSDRISDEQILEIMHSRRARSLHIPMEAQLESERWLRVNKVK